MSDDVVHLYCNGSHHPFGNSFSEFFFSLSAVIFWFLFVSCYWPVACVHLAV